MKINHSTQRILLFLVTLLLLNSLVEGSVRHRRRRLFPGRSTNRTFENQTNYRKSKKNLELYEKSARIDPFCNYYAQGLDFGLKSSYHMEFYKKRCNPIHQSGDHSLGPTVPRIRSVRNSRRGSKKNELSTRKKKRIDKLLEKSKCKTRKVMVPVEGPYPGEEYYPCKVLVKRCSGCCLSRLEECVPTRNRTRKFDVLRLSHLTNQSVYKAKIQEHVRCECKCKVQASDCGPGQIYEEDNCLCKCPLGSHTTCPQTKRWSERDCQCICRKVRECSTGVQFNHDTCKCDEEQKFSGVFLYENLS